MQIPDPCSFLPLKSKWYHILVTLLDGDRHGYAIIQEVAQRTEGSVRLWPAMLYRTLREMSEYQLIDEVEPPATETDARRRYFRLTLPGRRLLHAEANRLRALADLVPAPHGPPGGTV